VDFELGAEVSGELGEAPEVLVQPGRVAVLLTQEDLVVDQVEQVIVSGGLRREFSEEGLDRQPFPVAPALAMMPDHRERERIRARGDRGVVPGPRPGRSVGIAVRAHHGG
jgi:hypothetical protein